MSWAPRILCALEHESNTAWFKVCTQGLQRLLLLIGQKPNKGQILESSRALQKWILQRQSAVSAIGAAGLSAPPTPLSHTGAGRPHRRINAYNLLIHIQRHILSPLCPLPSHSPLSPACHCQGLHCSGHKGSLYPTPAGLHGAALTWDCTAVTVVTRYLPPP